MCNCLLHIFYCIIILGDSMKKLLIGIVSSICISILVMPNIRRRQDAATWCQLLKSGFDCFEVPEYLSYYRVVSNSLSSNKRAFSLHLLIICFPSFVISKSDILRVRCPFQHSSSLPSTCHMLILLSLTDFLDQDSINLSPEDSPH